MRGSEPGQDERSEPDETGSGEFVRALARGLAVIEAFDQRHAALTLTDVARRTGVSRATARPLLHTLAALGYVEQVGRQFTLPRVLGLGLAYLSSFTLTGVANPFMQELVDQINESCSIAVLDGSDIVYVARVPAKRIMSIDISIGTRLPAAVTSMGRVLLSDLPDASLDVVLEELGTRTRNSAVPRHPTAADKAALRSKIHECAARGWTMVDQELEEGLRSIAVPIRDRRGNVVAAIDIGTHAALVTKERLIGEMLPALQRTADAVSRALRLA